MKKNLIKISLLIAASSLSIVACEGILEEKERGHVNPVTMIHYFDFGQEEPNYMMKTGYHTFKLTGHDVTSFDEEENIAKAIYDLGATFNPIEGHQLVKTDRCITVECSNFSRPMSYMGDVVFYENGHIFIEEKYYGEGKFYYTMDEEKAKTLFKAVEEDIAKIESGERNYYEDAKKLCTFESFYAFADEELAREYPRLDAYVTYPYSVATGFYHNINFSNKKYIDPVYEKIKNATYTFKGYRTVDYDALRYSLFYIGAEYENCYGYILEGGCNFTTAGIAMLYGDYNDGKYHSLIAEYTISSEQGEDIYNAGASLLKS